MYANKYSNFWRRFFAVIIDGLVFLPLQWIDEYILSGAIGSVGVFLWGVGGAILGISYYVILHAKYGQTIGKMVMKVKVVDVSESRNITVKQSCIRDIVPIIMVPFTVYAYAQLAFFGKTWQSLDQDSVLTIVSLIMISWVVLESVSMLFNEKRRAVHDYIAGSVVVRQT
ncbi:RDD family protein [Vibrio mediterranei]|uniref:RDD family protein n=1 Tax=Vibrio mediterranei TaxID=689 RepID=A0ABX5D469_9VIBR|nr:RDD family protein [Vibrio mediterranei]PCD89676.1 RDD family protein [Vibrio mediterranei]PRQ64454.1 RDD family protein [Vibrio mediterranei]SBO11496.1 RDD family protein [Vibrio mediterranei]